MKKQWTTILDFIQHGKVTSKYQIVEVQGMNTVGDGGALTLVRTGAVGTPSQTFLDTGNNTCVDKNGDVWGLQEGTVVTYNGTDDWFGNGFGNQVVGNYELKSGLWGQAHTYLNKGVWEAGITLDNEYQFVVYGGNNYFANNPPYTTTTLSPDEDVNLHIDKELTRDSVSQYTDRQYASVVNLISGIPSTPIKGDVVVAGSTRFSIVEYATYTLPYLNRTKVFSNLPLSNGLYAQPLSDLVVGDFLSDAVDADNDSKIATLFSLVRDGTRLDFEGKMYRIFSNVSGLVSSSANPTVDNANELTAIPYLDDFEGVRFSSGGLYAANQGSAETKSYFPSTLSLVNCKNTHFEEGSTFEAKGESWGDADASFSEDIERRLEFLATNGGHAIYMGRCDGITGSPTARFAGSVGPVYFSSCRGVALSNPFSNPSSLGYAAYSFDAWVGQLDEVGFPDFSANILNPRANAETLTRREDNTAVGSAVYCGKGGVITEDEGVTVTSQGGYIADMYGNGTAKALGYAFGAGSRSSNINTGCVIRNCQEVVYTNQSTDSTSICRALDVDAVVGLTGMMFDSQSFGTNVMELTGKVRVNDSRVWDGENESLSKTSLIASIKPASRAYATVNCDAAPDDNPPTDSEGSIYSLISNKYEATYGSITIQGGNYITNGYLMRSEGWGSPDAESKEGLYIHKDVTITDVSPDASDGYIQYQNQSTSGVFTYLNHDFEGCVINTELFRSLNSGYTLSGSASLIEKFLTPKKVEDSAYIDEGLFRPRETVELQFSSIVGLSGPNSKMSFVLTDNRPIRGNSYLTSESGLIKCISVNSVTVVGNQLVTELLLEGDVRSAFTVSSNYSVLGG